jgi:hypothetical protein
MLNIVVNKPCKIPQRTKILLKLMFFKKKSEPNLQIIQALPQVARPSNNNIIMHSPTQLKLNYTDLHKLST